MKNHFVPAFYLKQWNIKNEENFFCADLVQGKNLFHSFVKRNSGNVNCFEHDLYCRDAQSEKDKVSLEKNISKQEKKWASIIQKVINDSSCSSSNLIPLEGENQEELVNFAIHLAIRSPAIVHNLKLDENINDWKNKIENNFCEQGFTQEDFIKATQNKIVQDRINNLSIDLLGGNIRYLKSYKELCQDKLGNPHVFICKTQKSVYSSVTSNYPVIAVNYLFGKGNDFLDIILPLSPDKILFIISRSSLQKFENLVNTVSSSDLAEGVNKKILHNYMNRKLDFNNYQIYSRTSKKEKIVSKDQINVYFIDN